MSDDQGSHHQAESLLRAMKTKDDGNRGPRSPEERADESDFRSSIRIDAPHHNLAANLTSDQSSRSTTPTDEDEDYDFRDTVRLSGGQVDSLQQFHQGLEPALAQAFSSNLRTEVQVQLCRTQQQSHHDFIYSLDDPSCVGWVHPMPSDSVSSAHWVCNEWMVSITPNLVFALIDRMLGGEPSVMETLRRPMTEIESKLIRRVIDTFLTQIQTNWAPVVKVQPTLVAVESHPRPFSSIGANDRVLVLTYTIALCKVSGEMTLTIPVSAISHLANRFAFSNSSLHQVSSDQETRGQIKSQVTTAPIEVVVNVAQSTIRTSDLLDLRVGDVIATEKSTSEPMELAIQDVPKFTARAGSYQGKKAVQIESPADPPCANNAPQKE